MNISGDSTAYLISSCLPDSLRPSQFIVLNFCLRSFRGCFGSVVLLLSPAECRERFEWRRRHAERAPSILRTVLRTGIPFQVGVLCARRNTHQPLKIAPSGIAPILTTLCLFCSVFGFISHRTAVYAPFLHFATPFRFLAPPAFSSSSSFCTLIFINR
jgi:hypothetical protein